MERDPKRQSSAARLCVYRRNVALCSNGATIVKALLGLLLVLIAAWPAHAAIAVAQTVFCEAQASTVCTTSPVTTTNGNLFIASTSWCSGCGTTFTSITDSKLNSYGNAIADTADGVGGTIRQDFIAAGVGGASHTFTLTGGSSAFFGTMSVQEVSGATASPLDKTATGSDSGTSHTTAATAATSQADELLIGIGGTQQGSTFVNDSGAGWTERTNVTTDVDSEGGIISSKVVSAIGTYTFTFTTGSSVTTSQGISTWKASASSTRQRCIGCGIDKKVIGE